MSPLHHELSHILSHLELVLSKPLPYLVLTGVDVVRLDVPDPMLLVDDLKQEPGE
jgi:hypothetical protein